MIAGLQGGIAASKALAALQTGPERHRPPLSSAPSSSDIRRSPIPPPTMYIRVKRNKTTYFIQCDPTETTLSIKQKLQSLIDQPASNQQLILLSKDNVVVLLDDLKTLADQKVENDAVVALTLRKDDNEFEDVFIARPEDFMTSS
ncbi:hypothetical protein GUJ93_ZPchr0003g18254 [Zizania palustris]|uniref:Ubiquitin-like domain-containing protein n=1 Tax=Zizania palustris TaxID=103762 RepID=A0A8J5SGU9_ZIZPA|nr:hypothetical protein GUJ93_ZPchr0003g18254 [Zizania palustris]